MFESDLIKLQVAVFSIEDGGIMLSKTKEVSTVAQDQRMYWKQRAKCKWDAYGDHSSKFFYKSVKLGL